MQVNKTYYVEINIASKSAVPFWFYVANVLYTVCVKKSEFTSSRYIYSFNQQVNCNT